MECRQSEPNIFVVSVEKHEEVFIAEFPSAFIGLIHSLPGEEHSQAVERRIPLLVLAYFIAARTEPQHIFYTCTFDWSALKKRRRWNTGCLLRRLIIRCTNARKSRS